MPEASGEFLIGLSSADITPPVGVTLVGYRPRASTELGHRLRAEALACRRGGDGWIFLVADVIGYPRDYVAGLRAEICARTGAPVDAIMVAATHTHSGPPTILFDDRDLGEADQACLAALRGQLAGVAEQAWRVAAPGRFESAVSGAGELMSNRRIRGKDGVWVNEWTDPEGMHPGFVDPAVWLVGVRRPGGRLDGLIVNAGCHPVVLGPASLAISADYPGYLKDRLEAEGVAGTTLFVQAGGANINPRVCIMEGAGHPRAMGERMAGRVREAVARLAPLPGGPLAWRCEPWEIVRTRDAIKGANAASTRAGETVATDVQALRAGDLAFVGVPGELFSEYNAWFRASSPAPCTVVASLANDYVGYLPTDRAQEEGAYETRMAPAQTLEQALLARVRAALAGALPRA